MNVKCSSLFEISDPLTTHGYVSLQVIESPLAKATVDTSVVAHWLAVEGVQPAVAENLLTEGGLFTCPV